MVLVLVRSRHVRLQGLTETTLAIATNTLSVHRQLRT